MATSGIPVRPPPRLQGFLRSGVGKLMLLSAACIVLFWAWRFHRQNANSDSAVTSFNISQLNHDDPKQRLMGVQNLYLVSPTDLGRTVLALVGSLSDTDWEVRRAAARSLVLVIHTCAERRKGDVKEEIDLAAAALLQDFRDPKPEVRAEAVSAVGELQMMMPAHWSSPSSILPNQLGPDAKHVLPSLMAMMKDTDAYVRDRAVSSYARIAHANIEEPGPIMDVIANDPSNVVRTQAIGALLSNWHDEVELYSLILRELKRAQNNEERQQAAWMLGDDRIALPTPDLLPALIDLLKIDDPILRETVPKALSRLLDKARPALPVLLPLARKEIEDESLDWTVLAMIAIDSESSETQSLLPLLVPLLHLPKDDRRGNWAMIDLMAFGKSAVPAVPVLCEALRSTQAIVRSRVMQVLGAIGPAAKAAHPDLMALLKTETDQRMKESVQAAMAEISKK